MKKINLIIPYFGKFPNYFPLFLKSCKKNPEFHWTIITDDKDKYDYPDNVRVVYLSFEEIHDFIQKKFDFRIALNHPKKFCDFKPAYGYLFSAYNEGFDYWGYCDLDVIYGNLKKYLDNDIFVYPKIFTLGHFTLIENKEKYNKMFMETINDIPYYKEVFSSSDAFNFDETFQDKININMLFEQKDIPVFKKSFAADIYTKSSNFRIVNCAGEIEQKRPSFFTWENGELYRYIQVNGNIKREEYMYIHLQKRRMHVNVSIDSCEAFKIVPNAFETLEVGVEDIYDKFDMILKKRYNMQYFRLRFNNLVFKIKRRIKAFNSLKTFPERMHR